MPRGRREKQRDASCPRRIRRFVEPALLLLLNREPMHGYALMDGLRHLGMADYPINKSAIYRALRSLEGRGVVESDWDVHVTSGPPRRVYTLTESGHCYLDEWAGDLRATARMLTTFIDIYDGVRSRPEVIPSPKDTSSGARETETDRDHTKEASSMKIVVSAEAAGLEAKTSDIFGRCPFYVYVDTETMAVESEPNPAANMAGGAGIQAAQHVLGKGVGAILSGNLGPNAVEVLEAAGIDIYLMSEATVADAVRALKAGTLTKRGEGGLVSRGAPAVDPRRREIAALAQEAVALRKRLAEIMTRIDQLEKEG